MLPKRKIDKNSVTHYMNKDLKRFPPSALIQTTASQHRLTTGASELLLTEQHGYWLLTECISKLVHTYLIGCI